MMFRAMLPALALAACGASDARPPLHVMSALPLFWAEGSAADLIRDGAKPAPVIRELSRKYVVSPIDFLDDASLANVRLLVLAQPAALRPEELVAIDQWVRDGGRLIIFADPQLEWESDLPITDPRRAPVTTLLGPLLAHWGLAMDGVAAGPDRTLLGHRVIAPGSGRWVKKDGPCKVEDQAFLAQCRIGKGAAFLIADADMLDAVRWAVPDARNSDSILALVEKLASTD